MAASPEKHPLAPNGPLICEIDIEALLKLSMKEAEAFRDVIHALGNVVSGFCCQPRFSSEAPNGGVRYNGAGDMLSDLADFLSGYETAVVNVATAATPADSSEVAWRAWTLIGFEADMTDGLGDFSVLAAEGARDHQKALWREGRAK